jgi:hypothetical protein
MFYLTTIHAIKVMCNLLIVIVENCVGVQEGRSAMFETDFEERLLANTEENGNTDYLDIMTAAPTERKYGSKGDEIRSKRNQNFIEIKNKARVPREKRANSLEMLQEVKLLERELDNFALSHHKGQEIGLDFVVDGKVESIRTGDGDRMDHFGIEMYLGEKFVTKVKRNLIQIRNFDNMVRHSINYDMPNLSDLSIFG